MPAIINKNKSTSLNNLHQQLTALNKSLNGMIPAINARNVDNMLKITMTTTPLAWNWSKNFNH